jgi:hypothetical protein
MFMFETFVDKPLLADLNETHGTHLAAAFGDTHAKFRYTTPAPTTSSEQSLQTLSRFRVYLSPNSFPLIHLTPVHPWKCSILLIVGKTPRPDSPWLFLIRIRPAKTPAPKLRAGHLRFVAPVYDLRFTS